MSTVFVAAPAHWRPLIDALVERGHEVYSWLGGRPSYNWYARFLGLEEEYKALRGLLDLGWTGATDLEKACRAVTDPEAGDVLAEHLRFLRGDLARACALRRAVAGLLSEKGVGAVVTTCTYDQPGRTVVAAARATDVPVVHVAHACQSADPRDAWYAAQDPGDVLCVPGERDGEWWDHCLMAHGRLQGDPGCPRVIVTGHPLWDAHWGNGHEAPPKDDAGPVVLWACESGANADQTPRIWGSREAPTDAWQTLLRALGGLRGVVRGGKPVRLVLKARQGEDNALLDAWAEEASDLLGGQRVEVSSAPAGEVVPRADVVVCQDSNLGVEALILGVPVVSLTRDGGGLFEPGRGVPVLSAGDVARLEIAIREALEQPPDRGALRAEAEFYCRPGGGATAEVCRVIEGVCGP